jgi:hypothetical protein
MLGSLPSHMVTFQKLRVADEGSNPSGITTPQCNIIPLSCFIIPEAVVPRFGTLSCRIFLWGHKLHPCPTDNVAPSPTNAPS